jgi:hypothetical protein
MEADDVEGIAAIILIRFTSRKEEAAKTAAVGRTAVWIHEPRPNCEAEQHAFRPIRTYRIPNLIIS